MAPEVEDSGPTAPVMLSQATAKPPPEMAFVAATASASTIREKKPRASASTKPVKVEPQGFLGISEARTWRPKLVIKNPDYPKVTLPGTFFIAHAGGFQLIERATNRPLGHYTKATIKDLERKYGKAKRTKKSGKHS